MENIRGPDWDLIKEEYLKLNGKVKLKEFAEEHGVKYSTLRSRKNRENWDSETNKNVATKGATQQKNVATESKNKNNNREPIAEEVKEVLENTELTDKQRLFCVIYSRCLNATKAYKRAYGCSYETAMVEGCKSLRNPKVSEQIEKLNAAQFNKEFVKKSVIQKYIDIAFADITDYVEFGQEEVPVMGASGPIVDEDGNQITKIVNTVKFKESPEIDGTIVSEVKQGKDGASIKLQDKMKALQWLSDRINLLSTETKIKIDNEKAKVQIARERLDYEKNKDNKSDKPIEISIKRKGED
ncbi:terminase small subunit [Clostridium botulinum]|uniref:terminase small subunit n=2 Tax=Clostridium botulinum TaxID=1491 RepID=UPI0013F0A403|nr:terminase small subunit [Clostridium botulinum]MBY6950333.1 terminase small subunit [Clostridium botulinum]MCR1138583.1 terminase small subunit [Clostridium botulinum]NEZ80067.1 terminase [Clostridium botulinum]NFA16774.1 terminase [Clostridium botulinum]NFA54133.1 terminase [Clostridium botulinum]